VEASVDVEFSLHLIKDQLFDQPWVEYQDCVMVFGIGGLRDRFRRTPLRGRRTG